MPQLNLPNVTINYEVWGDSNLKTITLLNGHTRPLTDFRMLSRRLVEKGFKVVVLDNRGAGETVSHEVFTLLDMAHDVISLWDHLAIEKASLLGISMGGFIAMTLAGRYPDRVSKLFLVSTASYEGGIVSDGRSWDSGETEVEKKLARYFSPAYAEKNRLVLESMAKQIAKGITHGSFLAGSKAQRDAIRGFDARPLLPALSVPTVVIHGSEDVITPLTQAEHLNQLIPGSILNILPGAGHLLLAERPQEFVRTLAEHLDGP